MTRQIQIRRGTADEHTNFTGAVGEITMDTTNKTIRVHDGTTAGGTILAKKSEIPTFDTTNLLKKIDFSSGTAVTTASGGTYTAQSDQMLVCVVGFGVSSASELMILKDSNTNFVPDNLLIALNMSNWMTASNMIYMSAGQSIYIRSRYGSVSITSYPIVQ